MPLDPRRSPSDLGAEQQAEPIPGEAPARTRHAVSIAGGVAVLRAALRNVPGGPGVYRMLDRKGDALYVGKARNLKSRIQNYTHPAGLSNRLRRMVAETAILEIVVTATEAEALLLECNLIKRLMPRYNVLLRDDKSFPFIHLTAGHDFPQLTKYRGARDKVGAYFGPFASAGAVNRTLITLQKAFLLRSCSDSVFSNRTRPCLLYQIKRCSAPCVGRIEPEPYAALLDQAKGFLAGRSGDVQQRLAGEMERASAALDFEAAVLLRHPLIEQELVEEALSLGGGRVQLAVPQRGDKKRLVDRVVLTAREALGRRLAESASQRQLLDGVAKAFGLEGPLNRIEVYDNSHIQGSNPVGAMIVAGPDGLMKNAYRKFNIRSLAGNHALSALQGGEGGDPLRSNGEGEVGLSASAPASPTSPRPSPPQGAEREMAAGGDDYAMMREVFRRRFYRALKEDPERERGMWPDLVLIDGGQGQLTQAQAIFAELGIGDVAVVAIAKGPDRNAGRERFFLPGRPAFSLEPRDPVLYFLQPLRDEAHRFAIGAHRVRREKAIRGSPLDEIAGIGARRKQALLHHSGSARSVARAGIAEIERVAGISKIGRAHV